MGQGPPGNTGTQGPIGTMGPIGLTGLTGTMGPIGLTGPMGTMGPLGPTGTMGPMGIIGDYKTLKSTLFTNPLTNATYGATLWCADGELCQVPTGIKGINMNNNWVILNNTSGQLAFYNSGKYQSGITNSGDINIAKSIIIDGKSINKKWFEDVDAKLKNIK